MARAPAKARPPARARPAVPHTAPRTAARPRGRGASSAPARSTPRIGLALAGGGPLGAIYEIGALCALEEALVGVDFTHLDGYLGISAGAFIAASLANGMTPRELCASFIENDASSADILDPDLLLRPAWGEFARRLRALPKLAAQAGLDLALRRRSKLAALERLGRAMPTGMFSGDALQQQLAAIFSAPGRSNDFRTLERRLVLVATDLDTGDAVPFGLPGHDHVPISLAVQASASLPGMFPPVSIDGRSYVDGALKKTLHASVLLDEGVELLIALNPLVPFDGRASQSAPRVLARGQEPIPHMVDGGLPLVLAQTFRSLIHSRLALGMKGYERSHPHADIVLFEPDQRDAAFFAANSFSTSQRRRLAEHAYQSTRAMLRSRRSALGATLARHGVAIDDAALADASRHLIGKARPPNAAARSAHALERLDGMLSDLEARLDANAPVRRRAGPNVDQPPRGQRTK
jgi:NTE family protein